ncbi:hypothetical protein P7C70_g1798, partial [Phenoliferia sp. Uapishka_3]
MVGRVGTGWCAGCGQPPTLHPSTSAFQPSPPQPRTIHPSNDSLYFEADADAEEDLEDDFEDEENLLDDAELLLLRFELEDSEGKARDTDGSKVLEDEVEEDREGLEKSLALEDEGVGFAEELEEGLAELLDLEDDLAFEEREVDAAGELDDDFWRLLDRDEEAFAGLLEDSGNLEEVWEVKAEELAELALEVDLALLGLTLATEDRAAPNLPSELEDDLRTLLDRVEDTLAELLKDNDDLEELWELEVEELAWLLEGRRELARDWEEEVDFEELLDRRTELALEDDFAELLDERKERALEDDFEVLLVEVEWNERLDFADELERKDDVRDDEAEEAALEDDFATDDDRELELDVALAELLDFADEDRLLLDDDREELDMDGRIDEEESLELVGATALQTRPK